MVSDISIRHLGTRNRYALAAAALVAGLAIAVLAGWIFGIGILKSALPGLVEMKVNTAVCFLLAALSLALQLRGPPQGWRRAIARAAAIVVTLVGSLSLSEWLLGIDLGIDQALLVERSSAVMTSALGRMAPNTAVNFLCDGLALLLIDYQTRTGRRPTQILCLIELVMALLALIGYAYGAKELYGRLGVTPMGLHTAIGFLILSTGILWARPSQGAMSLVTTNDPAGRLLRRMLPVVVILPILLAGVCLGGARIGLYDARFAFAAVTTASILVVSALLWAQARAMHGAELARSQHLREAAEHTAQIEAAYRKLQELEQLRQDLVNMIVHDLRGPLTNVTLSQEYALQLVQSDPREKLRHVIASSRDAVTRMGSLITTILDVSRLEAGQMPLDRSRCDLAELIRGIAARHHSTPLSVQVSVNHAATISCDRTLIERVVGNLVDNAVKASPHDHAVTVRVVNSDSESRVEVLDQGPGVPVELRARLFSKFVAKRDGSSASTGLGLAFCKLAIEAHGGTIGVDHEVSGSTGGSRFWFTLPTKPQPQPSPMSQS